MSTLTEITSAADTLPPAEQMRLLRHLETRLWSTKLQGKKAQAKAGPVVWPDFEGRLRELYGDKMMPNMVLEERENSAR